jgi:hypothetical protein
MTPENFTMNRNFNFWLALVVFIASALLLPLRQASGASLTRVTVTVTNTPVTSNVFYFSSSSGSRLLRWTNAFTSTTIRTNLLGTNQSTTNLFFSIVNYPTLGTTVRYASSNSIVLSGVSMVVTQLGNWCSISTSPLSGTNQYDLALPFDTLPETNRTNNASELVYGINKYSTNRTLENFIIDPLSIQSLTVLGAFSGGFTNPPLVWAGTTNIYTNTSRDFVVSFTNAPLSGLTKLTNVLPPAVSGRMIAIKDSAGTASGTNIWIVTPWNYQKIDGVSTNYAISNDFGSVTLMATGTNWVTVSDGRINSGEANGGANLGAGWFTYDSKSGVTLRFNGWTNGAGLTSSSNANTYTMSVANDGISDAMLRESAAVSVIGRSANSTGNPADIAAGANFRFLTRESDTLAWRQGTLSNYLADIAPWGGLADGDLLTWHAASGKWTNLAASVSAIDTLPELTDVANAFTGLADGDVLMYVAAMNQWTNKVPPGASGGEANTGSNLGIGWPTYDSKSVADLRFNTLTNGAGLSSASNANTITLSLAPAIKVDNLLATNAIGRLRSLVPSLNTTNQIDIASGPTAYYWTNLATNIVLQATNVWTAGVTNRTLDFFFTGHATLPFTVTFACPSPAGVAFRWGQNSATNGLTSFTVTNGLCVGATVTFWETNLAEAYFSHVR